MQQAANNNLSEDVKVKEQVLRIVQSYLKNSAFTSRKITDTPTDALQVVNRQYVTNNGLTANRPTSSVVGQPYLDMSLASGRGKPVWWNGTGWIDSTGTYV